MQLPNVINSEVNLKTTLSSSPYSTADGYTVEVKLDNGTESHQFVSVGSPSYISSTSDTEFELNVPFSVVSAITPGHYNYVVIATDQVNKFVVSTGATEVRSITNVSHERKVLNAINAVLENRASKDQQSYTIAGRTLSRTSITDLLALKKYYEDRVRKIDGPRIRTTIRRTWNVN